ncbi:hypothetical protein BbiDN127_I0006 (plasmid) [Borreliella bissettiae DN127]|uniref:Uncharacterized protein n=1 Tax=Borrelia bissettiae (strain DSM 17990 / CIP 109136 / DN127) TaxID=521010 RepID=G0AP65_BORBD|nr:hypothetical protein BbiDN127_I0006 [Borreliella bissettiae DN127]
MTGIFLEFTEILYLLWDIAFNTLKKYAQNLYKEFINSEKI